MAFLAGEMLTAGRANRQSTKTYPAIGSGTIPASSTNVDVTGATVTFTTETAGATYRAYCVWDFNALGASAASSTGRLVVDGVNQLPLVVFRQDAAADRGTQSQNYTGTLGAAGSHTLKLIASTSTNTECLGSNTSIIVEITEVV
ncbi:hypothetical protein ACH419_39205 [Streptomyces bobili]|uniref:hypothetical protein n=1 Tax=Streptomyces bobili TaxID=67280 RepID=UPI0037B469E5